MDIFEQARAIVRSNPNDFQPILTIISGQILGGKKTLSPAQVQTDFHHIWQAAKDKEIIVIGWLLSDTAIGSGKPDIDRKLTDLLLDHFEGDDQLNPATLQDWILGDIFHSAESKKRLADAVNGYRPIPRPPLGDTAQQIYDMLSALPETKGMTGDEIADALATLKDNPIILDASTIRKRHLIQLEPYGLLRTEHGYCIR